MGLKTAVYDTPAAWLGFQRKYNWPLCETASGVLWLTTDRLQFSCSRVLCSGSAWRDWSTLVQNSMRTDRVLESGTGREWGITVSVLLCISQASCRQDF